MQLPKLILGAVILFWGWQTDLLAIAVPMMLAYETSYLLNWRWHFTTAHFRQVSHLCTVLLAIILIYLWKKEEGSVQFIFVFFRWLPIICFPLLVAQAYSSSEGIDLRALLFFQETPQNKQQKATIFSLHYPFFAICLLSASAGNTRDVTFYLGVVLFNAIALWFVRSPRTSAIAWLSIILLAGAIGFFCHLTLHQAHLTIEKAAGQWLREHFAYNYYNSNPNQRSTAIGDIGAVKLTNKIVLRVKPEPNNLAPTLLRRVSYNNYVSGLWVAVNSEFEPLELTSNTVSLLPEATEANHYFKPLEKEAKAKVTIYSYLEEGNNLLNLPENTVKIAQLPVQEAEINQYDTVQTKGDSSRLAAYQVTYDKNLRDDSFPTREDLTIPLQEASALEQIIQELDLENKSEQEILNTVYDFFNTKFTYSLELARQGQYKTPLAAFLLKHRAGHCEYFATATALLLRAVGIPTRYAIGYSVHEYSSLEKQFIVRGKNAHAWNLVYTNGAWRSFDTTPSNWMEIEDNGMSNLVIIRDFLAWLGFKISQFSELMQALSKTKSFWLIMMPILLIVSWWLLRKRDLNGLKLQKVNNTIINYILVGADSELYLIEQTLKTSGLIRYDYESWQQWLIRLQQDNQLTTELIAELQVIIALHYRYRFDPQAISQTERAKLKSATESWLLKYREFISLHSTR
jgi:protein-glutamine gamma-glutamyltransferase